MALNEIPYGGEIRSQPLNENFQYLDQRITTHEDKNASLTQKGHVQLSNAIDSDDETKAATPKAIRDSINASLSEVTLFRGSENSGIVTLSQNINDFKYISVVTGTVGDGRLRTELSRGWVDSGFRVNEDYINVSTDSGKFVAKVIAEDKIEIIQADEPLRQVYGIKSIL